MRICPHCSLKTHATICPEDGAQTVDVAEYLSADKDPFVGRVFEERYRIDGVLGKGGFGAVYRAEQLAVGRTVAIKLLHGQYANDLKEVARFQREARAIAALRHPNIVQVHDFGQTREGFLYLVMECLEGRTFKHIAREEAPLESGRILDYLVQILDGLAEAHARGIIHRDLKPENIFCASIGRRTDVIKLLDFGIAKIIDEAGPNVTLTAKGMAVGSPRYMSPEQARAEPVTAQTDLYLVGLISYELLTGRAVFSRKSPTDYLLAHIRDAPAPPSVDDVQLTGPLVDLVLQCLRKNPSDRPESAEALMAAIEACRGRALDAPPTGSAPARVGASHTKKAAATPPPLPNATPPSSLSPPPSPPPMSQSKRSDLKPPPAPPGSQSRCAPPPPPGAVHRAPPSPPPTVGYPNTTPTPPVAVFVAVFLFVLLVGGAAVSYWMSDNTAEIGGRAGAFSEQQGADGPPATEPSPLTKCKSSRDCGADELCVDGVCEGD